MYYGIKCETYDELTKYWLALVRHKEEESKALSMSNNPKQKRGL